MPDENPYEISRCKQLESYIGKAENLPLYISSCLSHPSGALYDSWASLCRFCLKNQVTLDTHFWSRSDESLGIVNGFILALLGMSQPLLFTHTKNYFRLC